VSTKFAEYNAPGVRKNGFCFDPAGVLDQTSCCDDGNVYDPSTEQCCPINGVQAVTRPCPCGADAQCPSGSRCCRQRFPIPRGQLETGVQCSPYANFPTPSTLRQTGLAVGADFPENSGGRTPFDVQRCQGYCYDASWQICCNGVVCVNEYDRCCNDTCCNKHTSSCVEGYRPGSLSSRFNPLYFNYPFEVCTTIEAMNGRRAFTIFLMPITLLFATVASLALIIAFARRATEHVFELTEKAIVFLAAFSVLMATVYFFSPVYKYGITIIWINLALIAIAVIRSFRAAVIGVVIQTLLILYLIDPFPANHWLGFSHGATGDDFNANPQDLRSSLFETVYSYWRDEGRDCTNFYDYFTIDNNARDYLRLENPAVRTFGYCSRDWISTLMIFAGFLIITELLLLLLVIFSLVKLIGVKPEEVVQLEVRAEPDY
jgi:hypothetical protein